MTSEVIQCSLRMIAAVRYITVALTLAKTVPMRQQIRGINIATLHMIMYTVIALIHVYMKLSVIEAKIIAHYILWFY